MRYKFQGTPRQSSVEEVRTSTTDREGERVELRVDPRTFTVYFAGLGPWVLTLVLAFFSGVLLWAAYVEL